ncbi:MAG: response regulator [Hyphomonadaceae bacterium]|nr:response regulator [Hyphomonadaceae bacterium]
MRARKAEDTSALAPPAYRVLVLGEAGAARGLLRQLLLRQGIRAFLCETGEGALNAIERTHPDLVLFDVAGPSESELMALRRIRNCCEPPTTPLIVVLPTRVRAAIAHCIEAGANDFLTWPVDWMSWWPRLRAHLFAPPLELAPARSSERPTSAAPGRLEAAEPAPQRAYRGESERPSGRRINLRV